MTKLLLKLWPALTPIVVLLLWRMLRKNKKAEAKLSNSEAKLWIGTLVLSLIIAVICIVVLGVSSDDIQRGDYVRPVYDDKGRVTPGGVVPRSTQGE